MVMVGVVAVVGMTAFALRSQIAPADGPTRDEAAARPTTMAVRVPSREPTQTEKHLIAYAQACDASEAADTLFRNTGNLAQSIRDSIGARGAATIDDTKELNGALDNHSAAMGKAAQAKYRLIATLERIETIPPDELAVAIDSLSNDPSFPFKFKVFLQKLR